MKPQNSYLAISSNNQSYITTYENFRNACYQNRFQTFCHPLKKVLLLPQQKEDMPLSIFENHVFILTKYTNIQKIIPSIFISSAQKLTLALIIITLLMIAILRLILLKIQKISKKINKTPTRIELIRNTPLSSVTKTLLTDLTFNF